MKRRLFRTMAGIFVVAGVLLVPSASRAAVAAPNCTPPSTFGGVCVFSDGSVWLSLGSHVGKTGAAVYAEEIPPNSCKYSCLGHGPENFGGFAIYGPFGTLASGNFDGVNLLCGACYEHFGIVGPPPPPVPIGVGQVSECENVSYRGLSSSPGIPSVTRCSNQGS